MKLQASKTIFSFFGPPGSGKGTLAQRLAQELNFDMLSTGDLCRKHISLQTDLGKSFSTYLEKGHLIPDELITEMVKDWLKNRVETEIPVILDGYPRTRVQVEGFLAFMQEFMPEHRLRIIFINLSDEEIIRRLTGRLVCENKDCQKVYSSFLVKDLTSCTVCDGALIKRNDDKEEVIKERLRLFPSYRDLLLECYHSSNLPVEKFDVAGMTPNQVYKTFIASL